MAALFDINKRISGSPYREIMIEEVDYEAKGLKTKQIADKFRLKTGPKSSLAQ